MTNLNEVSPVAAQQSTYTPTRLYVVKARNNRSIAIAGQRLFNSYEAARRAVRSLIRSKVRNGKSFGFDANGRSLVGWMDDISRNPTRLAGYRIKAI